MPNKTEPEEASCHVFNASLVRRRCGGLILIFLLLSGVGQSAAGARHVRKKSKGPASAVVFNELEKMDAAANSLLAVVDERLPAREVCEIEPKTATRLLTILHAKLDQELRIYLHSKKDGKRRLSEATWAHGCEIDCHCSVMTSVFEAAGVERLSQPDREIYQKVSVLAMNQTKESLTQCARRQTWLCSSPLLNDLKKELTSPSPKGIDFSD